MSRILVVFQPEGRRVPLGPGENLLDAARRCGIGLEDLCDGRGTCGKCKVIVRRGKELLRPDDGATARLLPEDLRRGILLGCRTRADGEGSIVLEVPPESQRSRQRLQTAGILPKVRLAPSVRIVRTPGGWSVMWEARTRLAAATPDGRVLGMAFDVGSTKVAGFLTDLRSGELLETVSAANPQISHGEDVMARLAAAQRSREEADALHQEIIACANDLIDVGCRRAKVSPSEVYQVTVVGNTVMHHIFLGLPTDTLARAPYRPASRRSEVRKAKALGIRTHPEARITAPPVVGAFVGSDLVAGVLATRMHRARGLQFIVDVGTNTEICAGDRERLVACSSPSGPAFEGAHIRYGMRAADGAIERVSISPDGTEVDYRTIGTSRPRGLCGSALIDLLADLARCGLLDSKGRFVRGSGNPRVVTREEGRAFVVASAPETAIDQAIVLTQKDVSELQLAKAAIRAGIELLLDELGRPPSDIRRLHIAGAFGTYIAPESARTVGLFPDLPLERVSFVGNTAGSGARLVLLSRDERASMQRLSKTIRHLSLAEDPRFSRTFANALGLPPREPVLPTPLRRLRRSAQRTG